MGSIGENAYGKNLTVENLTYSTLNPPIGGFVNNPLTGNLDCGGKDLTNCNALTTATLNYTTLNPAISPGITNPLTVDLLCAGKNIGVGAPADKANEIKSVTGTFDNSALGVGTGTTLTTTGAVTAGGSTYGALCNVLTGLTVGTGIVSTTGDIVATAGKVTAGANIVAGTDLTVGTNIVAGTGIVSTTGDIKATAGKVEGTSFKQTGAGPSEFNAISLFGDVTGDPGSGVIIKAPQIISSLLMTANSLQVGPAGINNTGGIVCADVNSNGRFIGKSLQLPPTIWDVGTTSNLGTVSTNQGLYILLTTTTGTALSLTLSVNLPDTQTSIEGLILSIDGAGLNPAAGGPVYTITGSYASQLVAGGSSVAETITIPVTGTTFGTLRIKRDSSQRLKWQPDS